jgi:transposase
MGWILRTGAQWRELPRKYPAYPTCHRRFQQWVRSGQLNKALRALARELHGHGLLPPEEGLLDGTFASAKKGGLAVRPTKRGKGTKIMAIAAVTSLPLAVTVDRASPHETILVEETLAGRGGYLPGCNGSGDWSRATNITARTFSTWSASAA